jgi:centromeric protein E
VCFLEIYNEQVNDLLSDPKTRPNGGLKVREDEKGQVFVEGLEAKMVNSKEEILEYMRIGEVSRHTGKTKMNEHSSRSHTIFRIILESTDRMSDDDTIADEEELTSGVQVTQSILNLVDLAGSERAAQTGATGSRLKEGSNINQSLMVLGSVIGKLSSGDSAHINYRDSKLTRILQNSIGEFSCRGIPDPVFPQAAMRRQPSSAR